MRRMAWLLVLVAAAAPAGAESVALVGATIHTVSGDPIARGQLVIEDGRIAYVGREVRSRIGPDVTVVRLDGLHLYPSMIAPSTVLGRVEIGSVRGPTDITEVGRINPQIRAEVAVNPDSELLPVTRSNGVLLAATIPGGGLISGTSALIAMDGWTWEEMTVKAPLALHLRWPSMRIDRDPGAGKSVEEQERERDDAIREIRNAFADARAYLKARGAEGERGVPRHDRDVRWEAMAPVLDGTVPVAVHADDLLQIRAAVEWAEEEGVRMILFGGRDAWRVTDLLAEKRIPVVVDPVLALPMRDHEPYDAPYSNPARLHEAGIAFCVNRGGASNVRNLPYAAAMAASFGLPREEALRSVTLYPAEILGVADRLGSLEVGKDATLVVTDGDLLDLRTTVLRAWLAGRELDLSDRHKRLYEKYRNRPRGPEAPPERGLKPAPGM